MSISAEHSRQLTAADRMRIRIYLNTIATTMTALNFEFGEISHEAWLAETGLEHDHVPQIPRVPYLPTVGPQEGNLSHVISAVAETLGIGRGSAARQGQQRLPAQDNNEKEVSAQTSDSAEVEKRHQQRGRSARRAQIPHDESAPRTPAPAPAVEPKSKSESAGQASGSGPLPALSPNYSPSAAAASQTKKRQGANSPRWEGFKRRRFSGDNVGSPYPRLPPVWTLEQPPATVASFPTLKGVSSKDFEGSEGDGSDAFSEWARGSPGPSENGRATGDGGDGPLRTIFGREWLETRHAMGERRWDESLEEDHYEYGSSEEDTEYAEAVEKKAWDEWDKEQERKKKEKEEEEKKEKEKAEKAAAAPQPGPRYNFRPRKRTATDPNDGAKEAKKVKRSPSWSL